MQYEYLIDETWLYRTAEELNERGVDGWRLVAVHDPRPEEADQSSRPVRYVYCREVRAAPDPDTMLTEILRWP